MQNELSKPWFENNKEKLVLGIFLLIRIVIGAFPFEYGYHRDELYYIALSHHLDWGYLGAVPPLLPFCIAILRWTIGNSLFALHLFTATTGALVLIITWMMVKKMGGRLFSQILVLICVTLAPLYVFISSMCIYDCINILFWTLTLYFIVALLVTENKKYWIYFGIAAGLGLMSKLDMLWLGAGITIAMLLTAQRKYFLTWQLWVGGVIALLIASPYFIWIAIHVSLVAEFFAKYGSQFQPMTIFEYIREQIMSLNRLTFPVWIIGLYYFLFNKTGKKFRLFGIAYFIILALCIILHARHFLGLPFYIVLFAGGAVAFESFYSRNSIIKYIFSGYTVLIILLGLASVPLVRPILPMPVFLKYLKVIGMDKPGLQIERRVKPTIIPQPFADRFGWEEMAAEFDRICKSLSDEDRKNTVIVVRNFGEAGAIDFYREKYKLPPVICGHNQYYLWMPKDLSEKTVVISIERDGINGPKKVLNDVKQVGMTHSEYGIYYENNVPICLSKGWKIPPKEALKSLKNISL